MSKKNTKPVKTTKSSKDTKTIEDSVIDTDISLFDTDSSSSDSESVENVQNEEDNDKLSDDDMGVDDEDQDSESDEESDKEADDDCIYKYTKSSKIFNDEFDDDVDEEDLDIEKVTDDNRYVKPEERIGKPYLFKFERVRLLQDRAVQLANGSNPMIKNVNHLDPIQIAKLELETKKIPLYLERPMPGGKIEIWNVSELKQSDREFVQDDSIRITTKKIKSFPSDV
jgi:DNA-directed RNA polymerase subunit K/omega